MKSLILQMKHLVGVKITGLTLHVVFSDSFDLEWSCICGVACFPTESHEAVPAEMSQVMQRWQLPLTLIVRLFADLLIFWCAEEGIMRSYESSKLSVCSNKIYAACITVLV